MAYYADTGDGKQRQMDAAEIEMRSRGRIKAPVAPAPVAPPVPPPEAPASPAMMALAGPGAGWAAGGPTEQALGRGLGVRRTSPSMSALSGVRY